MLYDRVLSVGYVVLSMGVTFIYSLFLLSFLLFLRILWQRKNGRVSSLYDTQAWKRLINRKVCLYFVISFVAFHALLYVRLRVEFMGEDNANFQAKEYFVAGQVVNAPLTIASRFIHPENVLLKPYWALQEMVYTKGIQHLPEKDGEKAVWRQKWFLHPYIRNQHSTKDETNFAYSPDMVRLLNDIWQSMEIMATSTYVDSQMQYEQYYRNFPGMASYWTINRSQYLEKSYGSGRKMAQDPLFISRFEQLVAWLLELEEKWQTSDYTRELIDEHPIIRVLQQGGIMGNLFLLLQADILHRRFSCENPHTLLYRDVRNSFAGPKSPLFSMSPLKQKGHKEGYVDSGFAHFYKRILKQYCGYDVAGKEKPPRGAPYDVSVHHLFKKEYIILEELFHARGQ